MSDEPEIDIFVPAIPKIIRDELSPEFFEKFGG